MASQERLRGLASDATIPSRHGLSPEEFRDSYYAANRPVLLPGIIADWPAVERWTPDYLKDAVGSQDVQVQANRRANSDFEREKARHTATMGFGAFIDQIVREAGNDTYLTAYNSAANTEALAPLHADLGFLDAYLSPDGDMPRGMPWIGPQGTFTPLHHDLTNNLLLQVVGRKSILLVAPGETPKLHNDHHVFSRIRDLDAPDILAQFPRLEGVRVHRVDMNPGDALFVPLGWWHQVTALDFSVTITHTNFRWPNDFHVGHPESAPARGCPVRTA